MNKIIIMGRLTRDPELRRTQSGTAVASFTLAVDRPFTSGGERQADFIDVVAWRQRGEFVSKFFTKGQMCLVEGSLQFRDWTDKEGNKRRNAEVNADNIEFTDSKKSREGSSEYRDQSDNEPTQDADDGFEEMDDGDPPF